LSPGAFEIDFDQIYFAGDLNNRRLTINDYPSLQLISRTEALNQAVEAVYKGDNSELIPALFETYNSNLHKAVSGVDPEAAKLLKNNLTRMAAAKANYTAQLLQRARADKNGVIRPKAVYQKEAKKIISRANTTQAAEYNAAVHRTRIYKQMNRFQETKRLFPNIEWLRTRSASPREVHLAYVGRVWPMDDPFLQTNHPGCVWGCKCDWKNTDKPATDNQDLKPVPASPGLEGNPATTNEIFTDKHPYFKRVDKHIPDLGVLHNSDDIAYLNKETNGIKYQLHFNAQKEFNEINVRYLPLINRAGFKNIKFLPQIDRKETVLRERYFGQKIISSSKCPDTLCDGLFVELKAVKNSGRKTRRNIINEIGDAAKKSDVVILISEKELDFNQIAETQFKIHPNLQRIVIFFNDKMFDFLP